MSMGVRKGLLLLVAFQAVMTAPAVAEPLGKWALDEGSGQVVADATSGGHDGVLGELERPDDNDPSWVPGRFGSALRFDADSDLFVSIRNPSALLPAQVTVEAWVRRLGSPGRWRYVLSSGATECLAAPYGLYSGFDGGLAFYISDGEGYALSPEARTGEVWDGGWHYAVGTYDGQRLRLYLDGREVGAGIPTTLTIGYGPAATGVFIGTYHGSCSRPFTGDIDEVAVHAGALTPERIAATSGRAQSTPIPPQWPPVSGPPAIRNDRGAGGCLTVEARPRRLTARRRTWVRIIVQRGGEPAAGRRVALRGAGVSRTIGTGRKGRARLVVRASRRGRLRLKAIGIPPNCPGKTLRVAQSG